MLRLQPHPPLGNCDYVIIKCILWPPKSAPKMGKSFKEMTVEKLRGRA